MRAGGFWNGFSFGMGFELMRRILVPVIAIYLGLCCWWWLGPEKPECSSERKEVARRVLEDVSIKLSDVSRAIYRIEVLHFENDPTDFVTYELRNRLMENGRFDLSGTPFFEKLFNFLNLRNDGMFNIEDARKFAKKKKLDGVVIGRLNQFELTAEGVVLDGMLMLVQADGEGVINFPLSSQIPEIAASSESSDVKSVAFFTQLSDWERLGVVILIVLLLPVLLIKLIKFVLMKESNGAILSVLILITVVDGFAIRLLMGNEGLCGNVLIFCTLLLLAMVFNLFVFSFTRLRLPARPGEY